MRLLSALHNRRRTLIDRWSVHLHRLSGASIGAQSIIGPGVSLRLGMFEGAKGRIAIGDSCELEQGVLIDAYGGTVEVADRVFIGPYSVLYGHGGITIGKNTLLAMHCCVVSANHTIPPRSENIRDTPDIRKPITIGRDVWLGAGVRVLAGVTIGDGCIVGAGAVVTEDLEPYSIAVGVPARVVRRRE